jgi:ubiquinone/menaquinone biosynthesis C-methylase UbiE
VSEPGDEMEQEIEYDDTMTAVLELVWGRDFMSPGGAGNVARLVDGLDVRGKSVLDIGCGLGGPAFVLANTHGARVVGIDIEAPVIKRAQARAVELGLAAQTEFRLVAPGPLPFGDNSFDIVLSSGAFTQIEDKQSIYTECLRVLRPGGVLTSYDWMKSDGDYSDDMRYWFKVEGLTYAMQTPAGHERLLASAGFSDVETEDRSAWYKVEARAEYERLRTEWYPQLVTLIGQERADHFVEDWRAMVVVCEKSEMLQVYNRGRKPGKCTT